MQLFLRLFQPLSPTGSLNSVTIFPPWVIKMAAIRWDKSFCCEALWSFYFENCHLNKLPTSDRFVTPYVILLWEVFVQHYRIMQYDKLIHLHAGFVLLSAINGSTQACNNNTMNSWDTAWWNHIESACCNKKKKKASSKIAKAPIFLIPYTA